MLQVFNVFSRTSAWLAILGVLDQINRMGRVFLKLLESPFRWQIENGTGCNFND